MRKPKSRDGLMPRRVAGRWPDGRPRVRYMLYVRSRDEFGKDKRVSTGICIDEPNAWERARVVRDQILSGVAANRARSTGSEQAEVDPSKVDTTSDWEKRKVQPNSLWAFIKLDLQHTRAKGGRDGQAVSEGHMRGEKYSASMLAAYEAFGPTASPLALTVPNIIGYINWRRQCVTKRGKAPSGETISRELKMLKRVNILAAEQGLCPLIPRWDKLRVRKGEPDAALQGRDHGMDVVRRYINTLPPGIQHMCLLAMAQGWRRGTLQRLKLEYIVPSTVEGVPAFVDIPSAAMKSRKRYHAPVSAEAYAVIQRHVEMGLVDATGLLFGPEYNSDSPWYREATRSALAAIGYSDTITLRDLRTTFGNELERSGASLDTIRRLYGHSDIRTTQTYMRKADHDLAQSMAAAASRMLPASTSGGTDWHTRVGTVRKNRAAGIAKSIAKIRALCGAKNGTRTRDLLITKPEQNQALGVTTHDVVDATIVPSASVAEKIVAPGTASGTATVQDRAISFPRLP